MSLYPRHHASARDPSKMTRDWIEMMATLQAEGARFLLVGAHAMALHGVPRATQDIDLWVDPSRENASKVWRSIIAFGAPVADLGIEEEDFTTPGMVVQLGLPPNRIDLMTDPSGLDSFSEAWERRAEFNVLGLRVPVLSRADLIANKRASGRTKDLADLEALGEA